MAWYAYCITEPRAFFGSSHPRRPVALEGLRGLNGSQVFGYPSGEFAVIVSEYSQVGVFDQNAVLDHARVVSECFRNTTVLPFRFGTVFDTDEALRRSVRANRKSFQESVQQLRGKSEMHLKIVVPERPGVPAVEAALPTLPGGEYLVRLRERAARDRERQSKARAVSVQVHKLFNPLREEVTCKKVQTGVLIDFAHLIETAHIEKYQNRYNAAARQLKDCRIQVSGPWPPYHFIPGKLRTAS